MAKKAYSAFDDKKLYQAPETREWSNKTGSGWRRILSGPDKGHWQLYRNFSPVPNKIDRSGVKDALPNLAKGAGEAVKATGKTLKRLAENRNKEKIAQSREGKKQIQTGRGSRWVDDPDADVVTPIPTVNDVTPDQNDLATQAVNRKAWVRTDSELPSEEISDGSVNNPWNNEVARGTLDLSGDANTFYADKTASENKRHETALTSIKYAAQSQGQVNKATNNTYVTDYQTAIKQGVPQYYDEGTTAEGGERLRKSNVFTKAAFDWKGGVKEGDTLSVMTRSRREDYDRALHEWEKNKKVENNTSTDPAPVPAKTVENPKSAAKTTSQQVGPNPTTAGQPNQNILKQQQQSDTSGIVEDLFNA